MTAKIPLNIVFGELAAGKTSLIQHLIQQKPPQERWALLINEFGSLGLDQAIIESQTQPTSPHLLVKQLSGGCLCCSIKKDLQQALEQLVKHQPQRLIIEPTGLSEPESLLDLLLSPPLNQYYQLERIVALLDSVQSDIEQLKSLRIPQSLLQIADIVLLNKTDLCGADKVQTLQDYMEQIYPPKSLIQATQHGKVDLKHLQQPHLSQQQAFQFLPLRLTETPIKLNGQLSAHQAHAAIDNQLPYTPLALKQLITRHYQAQIDMQSVGWLFNPEQKFNWQKIHNLLQRHQTRLVRAKALIRCGEHSWMLFQLSPQSLERRLVSYRKDSRLEIICKQELEDQIDFKEFEQSLLNAQE